MPRRPRTELVALLVEARFPMEPILDELALFPWDIDAPLVVLRRIRHRDADTPGACGGAGWIISPNGELLARTTSASPFVTIEIDLAASTAARDWYPCNVWRGGDA